jgi:hypothetical protein
MGYTSKDLSLFEPLLEPSVREGTAYFELHPGELPAPNACWLEGSFFVCDAAFDFFTGCFERASESFDYFAFTRFERGEVVRLVDELTEYLTSLKTASSTRAAVFAHYSSLFGSDIWSDVPTPALEASVLVLGEQMRSFVEANESSGCLWVLGM